MKDSRRFLALDFDGPISRQWWITLYFCDVFIGPIPMFKTLIVGQVLTWLYLWCKM